MRRRKIFLYWAVVFLFSCEKEENEGPLPGLPKDPVPTATIVVTNSATLTVMEGESIDMKVAIGPMPSSDSAVEATFTVSGSATPGADFDVATARATDLDFDAATGAGSLAVSSTGTIITISAHTDNEEDRGETIAITLSAVQASGVLVADPPNHSVTITIREHSLSLVEKAVEDYKHNFLRATASGEWAGSVAGCRPGDIPAILREKTLQRINYFRRQVGYTQDLVLSSDPAAHAATQASALMMKANNALHHRPPNTWKCWTSEGAAASKGNLAWSDRSQKDTPIWTVGGFMEDEGAHNTAVGHRAWFLLPYIDDITIGATGNTATIWWTRSNTAPANTPEFVSWPPKGYVIADLVYDRWSLHVNSPDHHAAQAAVRMVEQGTSTHINLRIVHRRSVAHSRYLPYSTLTWEPQGIRAPSSHTEEITYEVTVSHVSVAGSNKTYTYEVTLIKVPAASAQRIAKSKESLPAPRVLIW